MKSHCKTVIEPIKTLINVLVEENFIQSNSLLTIKELIKNDKQHPYKV